MAILVAVLVRAFVLQTFYIPSPSMEHTLDINDRVLVNKLVYDFRDPHRGEIVVFEAPVEWQQRPRGRGLHQAGHRRRRRPRGLLRRAGAADDQRALARRAVHLHRRDGVQDPAADEPFDITVPPGRLWVMGDHRSASGDSLEHWEQTDGDIDQATIPEDAVVGPGVHRLLAGRPGHLAVGARCRSTAIPDP